MHKAYFEAFHPSPSKEKSDLKNWEISVKVQIFRQSPPNNKKVEVWQNTGVKFFVLNFGNSVHRYVLRFLCFLLHRLTYHFCFAHWTSWNIRCWFFLFRFYSSCSYFGFACGSNRWTTRSFMFFRLFSTAFSYQSTTGSGAPRCA